MSSEIFKIVVPLIDFPWHGGSFAEFDGLEIIDAAPDLRQLDNDLARDEREDVRFARHWLVFDWTHESSPSPSETTNLFLLSLWLVKPTKTHAKLRFHVNRDPQSQHVGRFTRILTRFSWIEGHVRPALTDADLRRAARYYQSLLPISRRAGRLYEAAVLHATGCWASHWHVSFICHSAAVEALLTYGTGKGITRRLAKSFACLTRRATAKRDASFLRFCNLYFIRSDINHGRTYTVPAKIKLRSLAQLEMAVRELWRIILSSAKTRNALEGTDAQRQAHFRSIEAGYMPPP